MYVCEDGRNLADTLVAQDWAVLNSFLSLDQTTCFRNEIVRLKSEGELRPAFVGRAENRQRIPDVRGDQTFWLEADKSSAVQKDLLSYFESLRRYLNERLFLGLTQFEGHFALYPAGAFYEKHWDRFRDDDSRTVSVVLYLNESWLDSWGGQLNLFDNSGKLTKEIFPEPGRLVLFLSDRVPHEVLAPTCWRYSFTGWFRRN